MQQAFEQSVERDMPGFDKARRVSRLLAILLGIGFWLVVAAGATVFALMVWTQAGQSLPPDAAITVGSQRVPMASLSTEAWAITVGAMALTLVPLAFALQLGRRIFLRFARGEVFTPAAITDFRAAAFWVIVVAVASNASRLVLDLTAGSGSPAIRLDLGLLFFGLCVYVIGYVMAEAQRLAEDNAGMV